MNSDKQDLARLTSTARGLSECVEEALNNYFKDLDGHEAPGLYELVISQVEKPLLETVLKNCKGNITRTAQVLGLNRGTVLSRLKKYGLNNH